MDNSIREKRKLMLSDLRFKISNINDIAQVLEQEYYLSKSNLVPLFLNFSVEALDDTSYESQSSDIFDERRILGIKVVDKINMRFYTNDHSKSIEVVIVGVYGNDKADNFIMVSGDDTNWVNGIMNRLNEIIDSIEPQPRVLKGILFANGLLWIVLVLYYFRLLSDFFQNSKSELLSILLLLGVPYLLFIVHNKINEYLKDTYPAIELQTGPKHLHLPSSRRKRILGLFSIVVIPLVTAFIYDLIKNGLGLFE